MPAPRQGRTAVYRLYDIDDQLIYVGMTVNPDARFGQHSVTKDWWPSVIRREIEWHPTRARAAVAESAAIRSEYPRWNIYQREPRRLPVGTVLSPEESTALYAKFKKARETIRATEPAMQAAALKALREGATAGQLARLTGRTPEFFSAMARSAGISLRDRSRHRS